MSRGTELRNMKGKGRTQGKAFSYLMAVAMAAPLIVPVKAVYDYGTGSVKAAPANARIEAYFAMHSRPFCEFEGVWYDWEDDETITLGCLEMRGNIRGAATALRWGLERPPISR